MFITPTLAASTGRPLAASSDDRTRGGDTTSLSAVAYRVVKVKEEELELARELYAEAYEPVREARSLEALNEQYSLLGAADALEKRARALHDWPAGWPC